MAESTTASPQPPDFMQSPLLSTAVPTDGVYYRNHFTEPEHAARHLQAIFTAELGVPPDESTTLFVTMADRPLIAFVVAAGQGGPAVVIEPVDSDRQLRLLPDEIYQDHRGVLRQIGEFASVPADHSPSTEHEDAYKTLINDIRSTAAAAREQMRADAAAYLARTTSDNGAGSSPSSASGAPAGREGGHATIIVDPSEDLRTQIAELVSRAEAVGGKQAPWQPAAGSPDTQPSAQQPLGGPSGDVEIPTALDFEALQGAFSRLARTNEPQIRQDPRWKHIQKLWATMHDAAGKALQGALRFRDDAQVHRWRALWLRGCEALSASSHQMMQRLERTRGKDSVSWNAMRLLHHQAEVSIAHIRGDLPVGEHAPIGTYDSVTAVIATPRASEKAALASPASPAAPAVPGLDAKSRAAARGVPGPLSWRMKAGGPVPQTAPAPPLPQRGPARDHTGAGR